MSFGPKDNPEGLLMAAAIAVDRHPPLPTAGHPVPRPRCCGAGCGVAAEAATTAAWLWGGCGSRTDPQRQFRGSGVEMASTATHSGNFAAVGRGYGSIATRLGPSRQSRMAVARRTPRPQGGGNAAIGGCWNTATTAKRLWWLWSRGHGRCPGLHSAHRFPGRRERGPTCPTRRSQEPGWAVPGHI